MGEESRTNAARASHPSRIVVANVLTAVFRRGERTSRNCTRKSALHRCSPEACASGLGFGASILLGRRISEEAAKPGHQRTGHAPSFPRRFTLEKSPATLNPGRNRFRTSHAFDCKHCAAGEKLTQRQTAASLCKNCGAEKLPVEREGKSGSLFVLRFEKLAGFARLDGRGRPSPHARGAAVQ